jgi:capsular polysaccharide transport system ATP-binding protein
MIVEMRGVRKRTRMTVRPVIFENLNLRIEDGAHIGLLGHIDSGLDAIVDMICGADAPDAGRVIRGSKISWPIPDSGFIHKHRSLAATTRFIAQLYEVDPSAYLSKVVEMASLQEFVSERLDHCPKSALSRMAFALGACLPFETYLFTAMKFGDKEDAEQLDQLVADLTRDKGLVLATSQAKAVKKFCNTAFVLDSGRAVYYEDIEAALEHLERIAPKRADLEDTAEPVEEEDRQPSDDFF